MSCHSMLDRMLEADPGELAGLGDSALATHVRACARCRRVAGRIIADTRLLAAALRSADQPARVRQAPSTRGRRVSMTALPLAAALAAVLLLRYGAGAGGAGAAAPAVPPVVVAGAPGGAGVPGAPPAERSGVVGSLRVPARGSRVRASEVPAARPVAERAASPERPLARVASAERRTTGVVTVDPPPGTRAAVLRTSDPAVTLVWLH